MLSEWVVNNTSMWKVVKMQKEIDKVKNDQ